jgi:esterase/lipase
MVVVVFSIGERTRLLTWGYEGMRRKVVLEAGDEGGYTAYVPSLPGCMNEGETVADELLE